MVINKRELNDILDSSDTNATKAGRMIAEILGENYVGVSYKNLLKAFDILINMKISNTQDE